MKTSLLAISLLCLAWTFCPEVDAQDVDAAISKLTEDVASRITDNGNKKVTVLDFTDLQGNPMEVGRYLAEQITVDLVLTKRAFSVLDRANLKKILDEHKLTTSGLIEPENAKKLGMFSGVDAMIFGTVVSVGSNVSVSVKIITTETAEVVGGAKTRFKADDTIRHLLTPPAKPEAPKPTTDVLPATQKPAVPVQKATPRVKLFGDLEAKVASFQLQPGDNIYGSANLYIVITNTSETKTWGVAFPADPYNNVHLSNNRGDDFKVSEVSGIEKAFEGFNGFQGAVTDIPPSSAISILAKAQVRWAGNPGDYRPYRFQTTVIYGEENQGRHPFLKKYGLSLEVK